jgi:hypothetical protein
MELNPSQWQMVSDPFEPLRLFPCRIPGSVAGAAVENEDD